MNYRLIILDSASEDILDAYDWYEIQSEFGVAYLIERLEEALKHISETPLVYQKVHREFRQIVLKPFPYVVLYYVKGEDVIVYKLWHTSRNPKKKFK